MTKSFEFISDLTDLAKEREVKLVNVSVSDRRNKRGEYDFIKLSFLCPKPGERKLEKIIAEIEESVGISDNNADEESEKEEVLT